MRNCSVKVFQKMEKLEMYYLVVDVIHGIKKVKILVDKLGKFPSKKANINFYWDRDMAGKFNQV